MNRKELEARLAASAVKADQIHIDLPSGESLSLRRLNNDEMIRASSAAGTDLDREARFFTSVIRFGLIDDDGQPLLRSFEEAASFVNTLTIEDFVAVRDALQLAQPPLDDPEVMEAGKAS